MTRSRLFVASLAALLAHYSAARAVDGPLSVSAESLPLSGGDGTRAGECRTDASCSNFGENWPAGTFSTTSSTFVTVANNIWASDYSYYNVTSGKTYEWTLCSTDGGVASYDSELTLRSQNGATLYCFSDDFCGDDAKIRWTATFTGVVRILVSEFHCQENFVNTTLRWRCEDCGGAGGQPDLAPYQPANWNDEIPIGITQLPGLDPHSYAGSYYDNQTLYVNFASGNFGDAVASNYTVRVEITGTGGGAFELNGISTNPLTYTYLSNDAPVGPLAAGSHTFRLYLDYANTVVESNETNNYYERTINVLSAPADIRVSTSELNCSCTGDRAASPPTGDAATAINPVKAFDLTDFDADLGAVLPDQVVVRFRPQAAAALHAARMREAPGDAAAWLTSTEAAGLALPDDVLALAPFVSGHQKATDHVSRVPALAAQAAGVKQGHSLPEADMKAVEDALVDADLSFGPVGLFYAKVPEGSDLRRVCLDLMKNPEVIYAHPSPVYEVQEVPNDTLYPRQWNLTRMGLPAAWDVVGNTLGTTRVCVVDTGVRIAHNELAGRYEDQVDIYLANGNAYGDADPNNDDTVGHGTSCAGIVGSIRNNSAIVAGIAPVTIIPVNAWISGGSVANYFDGVMWGVDHGADVVSLSLGGHRVAPFQAEIDAANYAQTNDVIVCAASGNEDTTANDVYPCALPYYICVGAVDDQDLRVRFANWGWGSNYGATVDVCAPGQGAVGASLDSILTLDKDSNTDFTNIFNGTSAATPQVAGVAAMLRHLNGAITTAQVRDCLESTAEDQIGDPAEDVAGWDPYHGHGLVNAPGAVACGIGQDCCFTIYNDGGAALSITSVTRPAWAVLDPAPPYDIAGGGGLLVCVTPDCGACAGSDLNGQLVFNSNDGDETPAISLQVTCPAGAPAATVTSAVARKSNVGGPGAVCDLPLLPGVKTEMRQGGVTQVRIAFNVAPGGPGPTPVTLQQKVCPAPGVYGPYSGSSVISSSVAGNELVLNFTPGLENLRTYRINIGPSVTSIPGQFVEVRGLAGDVDNNGLVNAVDRAVIVGAWTSPSGFSCPTDLDSSSRTNAIDRALVVGAWTAPSNCAP